MISKVDPTGSLTALNCGSAASVSGFSIVAFAPTFSTSASTYSNNIVDATPPTWTNVVTSLISTGTDPLTNFYTMQDTKTNKNCAFPYTVTPESYDYYM